ncbi:MAG: type VI secretion system tube protein Hcp [Cellvibrionaceae bacterium]|nr:type VI secretion system tube protein Hcp [Cellvibrionaceae bacterium]
MSAFIWMEDTKGEASDSGHKDWIDVESWRWGAGRKITSKTSTRGDRESANATISDLHITKFMDSATPKIFINSCCGRGQEMKIHLTKTGTDGGADVFMEYTLKNAIISDYQVSGSKDNPNRPLEHITISFIEVDVKYIPYDENGNAMSPIAVGFDTASNTKK